MGAAAGESESGPVRGGAQEERRAALREALAEAEARAAAEREAALAALRAEAAAAAALQVRRTPHTHNTPFFLRAAASFLRELPRAAALRRSPRARPRL